jgi:hypothetical protein
VKTSLKALALLALAAAAACTHSVHLVHVSDFEGVAVKQAKRIEARSEKFVILHFSGDVDYVDQAYRRLQDKCPKGRISGITTQHSTSHGFLSYTQKIVMQGLCIL